MGLTLFLGFLNDLYEIGWEHEIDWEQMGYDLGYNLSNFFIGACKLAFKLIFPPLLFR